MRSGARPKNVRRGRAYVGRPPQLRQPIGSARSKPRDGSGQNLSLPETEPQKRKIPVLLLIQQVKRGQGLEPACGAKTAGWFVLPLSRGPGGLLRRLRSRKEAWVACPRQ